MNYRADIQILRGLSVLLVIIYHLQTNILKNGFLGVDIFFVISGFLMAVLYFPKNSEENNALSWDLAKSFFARRARRILPAYFVSIVLVLLLGFVLINNAEYQALSREAVFSALLIPNFSYSLQPNYFDTGNFRPLLHLWTIGVEAQFYLIVPIIFAILSRSKKLLIALVVLSFIACALLAARSSNMAFFMLPMRFWEFMVGFLAAHFFTNNGNTRQQNSLIGLIGLLLLIVIPNFNFGIGLRHPGPVALLICISTATVLIFGLPKVLEKSVVGRTFETLGKYSYSTYIVHYPVILFFVYQPFSGTAYSINTVSPLIITLAIIGALSVAMFHLIEQPLRLTKTKHSAIESTNRPFFNTKTAFMASVLIAVVSISLNKLQRSNHTPQQLKIIDAVHDKSQFRCGTSYGLLKPFAKSCDLTTSVTEPYHGYLLVGNSHADAIKIALSESAIRHNVSLRLWKENFSLGWSKTTVDSVISEAKKFKINTIILHTSKKTLRVESLRELLRKTQDQGISVVYIDPVPTWLESVPGLIWKEVMSNQPRPIKTRPQHHLENTIDLQQLNAVVDGKYKNFTRIYTAEWLCKPYCQLTDKNGIPIYYDSNHLNLTGAKLLMPVFNKIFE